MKRRLCLLLAACLPCLAACSPSYLDRQIYPICLSVDVDGEGRYQVGIQAPKGSADGTAVYDVLSASGETLEDALLLLSASTPYPLNFSQIRLCLISYELAAVQELRPLLRVLLEMPSMRPTAHVMIALGNARAVMEAQKPDFGMRLSTHLNLLFERLMRQKTLPEGMLSYCVRELGDGRCDLLLGVCAVNPQLAQPEEDSQDDDQESASPVFSINWPQSGQLLPEDLIAGLLPHSSENPVEYLGSAVVCDGRVSGLLSAAQTQLALRVLAEATLRVAIDGDRLQLQVLTPPGEPLSLEHDAIAELLSQLQTLSSDPLGFGCLASMAFYTESDWRAYRFDSRYETAEILVAVKP